VNLGALLCEASRCADAATLYEKALQLAPGDPLVHFNHAIALEDLGRHHDALASYKRSLELDPSLIDAHFNAARLCDQLGDAQGALRHFSAYRRSERSSRLAETDR
jgi:tetratricopeptide (TPR) repeat protein